MPQSKYVAINIGIKERFYIAIRELLAMGVLRGRQTYCRLYGIDKRNFYAQEADLTLLRIQLYWLVPLVHEYGVSAKWLLTGEGYMFEIEPQPKLRKKRAVRYPKEGQKEVAP